LKECLLPGINEIQVELIQAGGETLKCEIHKFITFLGTGKNSLSSGRSLIIPIYKKESMTTVIIKAYHWYQLHTKLYPTLFSQD
jgi:hypothetical protein